jgi:hypothetical protein
MVAPILVFFAASGFANPAQPQESNEAAHTYGVFGNRVQEYISMLKDLEDSGSPAAGKSPKDSAQIDDPQHALAGRIADARRGSRQGDIFTHEVAEQFVKIIRKAFKEPGGRAMRRTIQEDGAVKPTVLHVNDVYPEGLTRTTMPPTYCAGYLPCRRDWHIASSAAPLCWKISRRSGDTPT